MADVINGVVAPDQYAPKSTIEGGRYQRFIVDVANATIYWQLQIAFFGGGGNWEGNETQMTPGSRVILEPATGFRFRAKVPLAQLPSGTNQAIVTVRGVT